MKRSQRETEDWVAGAVLRHYALLEIRAMAGRRRPLKIWPDDDFVACIRWLADLCDNMPFTPRPQPWWDRKAPKRRFAYAWEVAGPLGQRWIVDTLAKNGMPWTPPTRADL
ncbi:hypothetical protein [Streptacidiphilus anmyonensis]|uniref:hypothetical protein n=1 Tax=Streptacidiphilus anmyonensis TaxID=405782 RepID=UPI0005AA1226|nr:hypothetical protein [Streptacidiphilus anmyonensis]